MTANDDGIRGLTPGWKILWISVLGLYLELLIIRWVGTEIRIFAYLQNTVLVVCFLGLGLGFMSSRDPIKPRRAFTALAVLAGALALPWTRRLLGGVSEMLNALGDVNIWFGDMPADRAQTIAGVALGLAITLAVMIVIVEVFVPIGRLLGRLLDDHPRPIQAYSINVVGSLLGMWLFVALGAFEQPPIVWFAVFVALALPWRRTPSMAVLLLAVVVTGAVGGSGKTVWSPYQKLAVSEWSGGEADPAERVLIRVNNVGYQQLIDLRPETLRQAPELYAPEQIGRTQYDLPFLMHPDPQRVLIVGAGAGNDASAALRNGARDITAVEIDPTIVRLGDLHPERPYDSDRITVVTDDARSFFARTTERFDLILFALLDSHTTTSMTNARLDHYVYTRESLERARTLLAPGGVIVLKFDPVRPFVIDRIDRLLGETFDREPMRFPVPSNEFGWGSVAFVTGDLDAVEAQLSVDTETAALIAGFRAEFPLDLPGTTRVTTDDWPFLYLEAPRIPVLFVLLGAMLVALLAYAKTELGVRVVGVRSWDRELWHFFALGAGFLLLEVQGISKASVALGNTWVVNAIIITGVLLMVLVANLVVSKKPRIPTKLVYLGLVGTPLALYAIDLARFAFLPYGVKAVVIGALTTLPMLFSGIVFAKAFASSSRRDLALGANLFGALLGALLQSVSFVTGIKALLLIVAVAYAIAVMTAPRPSLRTAGAEAV